ncbi:sigma 54-interacting transcriptional regulator [Planococcus glaciei]|uniref:HTH-type transcriptional regulatory protein TyrR n=1 Tax=Planococcus glaciei TaxID=459472 RepID=A0A7H8QAS5_9BACL|nr:sigma 54-interacting transcriptional regulator [Planococcus glaciei]MBX0315237.1 sigma 54-interacting transcriptional regulator [Planococcus glaciei]QKX51108.1 sigma 54-interacting transcriptional regulator [Planococcus glaciei]
MEWKSLLLQLYDYLIVANEDGVICACEGEGPVFSGNISGHKTMDELETKLFTEGVYSQLKEGLKKQVFRQTAWMGIDVLTIVFKEKNHFYFAYTHLVPPYIEKENAASGNFKSSSFIVNSQAMEEVAFKLQKVAAVGVTVLLLGESGVGKEMAAKTIHQIGNRSDKPFVSINCGAIPDNLLESELFGFVDGAFTGAKKGGVEGKFRQAHTGILFLDEVGELSLPLQVKILRALEERVITPIGSNKSYPVDIQVIAATNKSLEDAVAKGEFREDLYYRLNVVPIMIPSLRERVEEIPSLVQHFVQKFNARYQKQVSFSPDAVDYLCLQPWPGNIRELENAVDRLIVLSNTSIITSSLIEQIIPPTFPTRVASPMISQLMPLQEAVEIVEEELITMAMEQYKSVKLASNILGISQPTMSRKYKKIREMQKDGGGLLSKRRILEEQLNKHLRSITIVTAVAISPEEVRNAVEDKKNEELRAPLSQKFTTILQQEGGIKWVFVFQMQEDGKVIHVAASDGFVIEPGEEYIGPPEVMKVIYEAFKGRSGVTPLYEDEYGVWKSSIAPLYDEAGKIMAVIGFDYSEEFVNTELQRLSKQLNITL